MTVEAPLSLAFQPISVAAEKDHIESKRVCRAIQAKMKQCWVNARKAIQGLNEYAEASYVEGWLVTDKGAIIEHGWIVSNSKVIDPTLPETVATYFPGLEFQGRKGIAAFLQAPGGKNHPADPFHFAFGWGGSDSPSYQKAFRDALHYQEEFFALAANRTSKALARPEDHSGEGSGPRPGNE
jgi:hypothetical protein